MDEAVRRAGRWWMVAAALMAVILMTAAACGDDDDASTTSDEGAEQPDDGSGAEGGTGTADATLEVVDFEFTDVAAPAGGTLEVVNSSGAGHTVTADDGAFDDDLGDGESITVEVPAEPGDYPFHCEIHPSMTATLTAE